MRILYVFVLVGVMFILEGCGEPSESDGRKIFEKSLSKQEKIKLFKKTNGEKMSYRGRESYTMHYKAEIVYPNGLNLQCKIFRGKNSVYQAQRSPNAYYSCMSASIREKGEKTTIKGIINFKKTENGWIGEMPPSFGF